MVNQSRAADNLKAQISNKLNSQNEKKTSEFDTAPPPIVPTGDSPSLLEMNPLEIARQMVLLDFELLSQVKPLEYLYYSKPSKWSMLDESQDDEDPQNIKTSPHVVAVIYRFSDVSFISSCEFP